MQALGVVFCSLGGWQSWAIALQRWKMPSKSRSMPRFLSLWFFSSLNVFLPDRTSYFAISFLFGEEMQYHSELSLSASHVQQVLRSLVLPSSSFSSAFWSFLVSKGLLFTLVWGSLPFLGRECSLLRSAWLWWEVFGKGDPERLFRKLSRVALNLYWMAQCNLRDGARQNLLEGCSGLLGHRVGFLWWDVFWHRFAVWLLQKAGHTM